MTVRELKNILNRVPDNTYIEVIQKKPNGIQHLPIQSLQYDQTWDSWQIVIE